MSTETVKTLSLALVHDYLTQQGGAERVALAVAANLPVDSIYSTIHSPGTTYPAFSAYDINTTFLNRFSLFRRDPRWALPFLPAAIDSLKIENFDAVICSSSGWAHAVKTDVPKVAYFHTPARWLYEPKDYLMNQSRPVSMALAASRRRLERWDRKSIDGKTKYVANSRVVQDRIQRVYGIESTVVHPPVGLLPGAMEPLSDVEPGYWLTVARGRGYKNTHVIVDAARKANQQLVVVGGDEISQNGVVRHTGNISESQLRWLYKNAKALIAMSYEDFGLTPIEAHSFGTPVLALRAGGYLDTIIEGENGLFVNSLSIDLLIEGMREMSTYSWDTDRILKSANRFSPETFSTGLLEVVRAAIG